MPNQALASKAGVLQTELYPVYAPNVFYVGCFVFQSVRSWFVRGQNTMSVLYPPWKNCHYTSRILKGDVIVTFLLVPENNYFPGKNNYMYYLEVSGHCNQEKVA